MDEQLLSSTGLTRGSPFHLASARSIRVSLFLRSWPRTLAYRFSERTGRALEEKWSATSPSIVASSRRACPTFTGSTEGRCTRHLWLQLVCLVEPSSILPFHAHTGFPLEPHVRGSIAELSFVSGAGDTLMSRRMVHACPQGATRDGLRVDGAQSRWLSLPSGRVSSKGLLVLSQEYDGHHDAAQQDCVRPRCGRSEAVDEAHVHIPAVFHAVGLVPFSFAVAVAAPHV